MQYSILPETYFTRISTRPLRTPSAFASNTRVPDSSPACTKAVSWPLKSFIRGSWNDSRLAGFPLATALNLPAPFTVKLISRSSVGQKSSLVHELHIRRQYPPSPSTRGRLQQYGAAFRQYVSLSLQPPSHRYRKHTLPSPAHSGYPSTSAGTVCRSNLFRASAESLLRVVRRDPSCGDPDSSVDEEFGRRVTGIDKDRCHLLHVPSSSSGAGYGGSRVAVPVTAVEIETILGYLPDPPPKEELWLGQAL